ncbi:ABC transporter ATP-binding protein [Lactobacillus delbrueckii]|uniref:ABC transporter ATP-binding protein n=1 Tax=Lactobacillus delbrueckii TaxID=1584 RepID=UPI001F29D405|nr:ABC transporter ATP-binding protein [Lactobacillus delbrueckii]GHN52660.1 ABC transporter related protein [Lactobacillus delbrueckii]
MFGIVLIIYFGGIGWNAWDLASFTTFLACFTKLATNVSHAVKLFNAVQKAQVSWVRIRPLMSDPIYDHYQKEEKVINDLTFDHVTTFYHGYPETAVKDINFTASANEIIGITGEVACGKRSLQGHAILLMTHRVDCFIQLDQIIYIHDHQVSVGKHDERSFMTIPRASSPWSCSSS